MVNYGYGPTCKGWDETKKRALAYELQALVMKYRDTTCGDPPYVELDGFYEGVRIRKITYLSEDRQKQLVAEADDIYDKIMGIKTTPEVLEWRTKILAK